MRKRGSACADVVPFKLVVAGGAGSKVFESCDRILNQMPVSIEPPIDVRVAGF